MHSQKNMMDKVDVGQLKEFIRGVKDPLKCPPIPLSRKAAVDVLEYESNFKTKELRTQARFRHGVNNLLKSILQDKGSRGEIVKKEAAVEGEARNSMRYSGMVKVGNWEAERGWAEEEMGRFLRLRARKELMVQKTRELFSQALKPLELAPKQRLQFGDNVQLIAPRAKTFAERGAGRGLTLSVVLEQGHEGAVLSASPLLAPCTRNVFELCPIGPASRGPLRYGQEFSLRLPGPLPYYVSVLPNRIIPAGNSSRHPQVHLSSRQSWASGWRLMPPSLLGTARGKEVPAGGEVVVLSTSLNRTLAAETDHWFSTLFGLECEATAYQYPPGDNNIWRII